MKTEKKKKKKKKMLHIKLMEVEQRAPCKHIYYVLTNTLDPWVGSKGHYF